MVRGDNAKVRGEGRKSMCVCEGGGEEEEEEEGKGEVVDWCGVVVGRGCCNGGEILYASFPSS